MCLWNEEERPLGCRALTLIIGAGGSGKSAFAENYLLARSRRQRIYVATMQPVDAECMMRIEKHRAMRAEKSFVTAECYTHLEELDIFSEICRNPCHDGARYDILLECISNLAANECYAPQGRPERAAEAVVEGVRNLAKQAEHLVIVSNDVFSDGISYDASTQAYMRCLGEIHMHLAEMADEVIEVISGCPLFYKELCVNNL